MKKANLSSLIKHPSSAPFLVLAAMLCFACLAITLLTDGSFYYTLDDPYIHLALAENIIKGHYGVNLSEFSAPSSSILWPLIISPFSKFELTPLIINIFFTFANFFIIKNIISHSPNNINKDNKNPNAFSLKQSYWLSFFLVLIFNGLGLILMGMEHVLQTFLTLCILYGLIIFLREGRLESWLLAAILINPLIRYEGLALSGLALLLLIFKGHPIKAILTGSCITIFVLSFSAFLFSKDLGFLPSSVITKSASTSMTNEVNSFFDILLGNITHPGGMLMLTLNLLLTASMFQKKRDKSDKWIASIFVTVAFAQLLMGRVGWYGRYEIFINLTISAILIKHHQEWIKNFFISHKLLKVAGTSLLVLVLGSQYLYCTLTSPYASRNIFQQHYQIHQFATVFWKDAVAINDLGYVAYKNDAHVLDLWGLGSLKAIRLKKSKTDDWMNILATEKSVELAIIYKQYFSESIPDNWIEVAKLSISEPVITPGSRAVSFFFIQNRNNISSKDDIIAKLKSFESDLPDGVTLKLLQTQ